MPIECSFPQPPGPVPPNFLTGSMTLCTNLILEAQTNKVTVIGSFNQIRVMMQSDILNHPESVAPLPPIDAYLRLHSSGERELAWQLYSRVMTWAGEVDAEAMPALLAHGMTKISAQNNGTGEVIMKGLPGGLKLTPWRRQRITLDMPVSILHRYELWAESSFVLAHTIDIEYTFTKQAPHDHAHHAGNPSAAGAG